MANSLPEFPGWTTLRFIDDGGQGMTYLVSRPTGIDDPSSEFAVAKLLKLKRFRNHEKMRERFEREVIAMKNIDHTHVVRLIEADFEASPPFYVMEYCEYGSLANRVDQLRTLDFLKRIDLFLQICSGISVVHEIGIIHRDIKPGNILLRSPDHVVIGDFGIAYFQDLDRVTSTNEKVGPANFIAPELQDGRAETVAPTADIYSLGKLLHWIFTTVSFAGEQYLRDERNIVLIHHTPLLMETNRVIGRAIEYDPVNRYQTVQELIAAVEKAKEVIENDIPAMDEAYMLYYRGAAAAVLLKDCVDTYWTRDARETTSKAKAALNKIFRCFTEYADDIERAMSKEYFEDLERAMRYINERPSTLPLDRTIWLGQKNAVEAVARCSDYFEIMDEAYAELLRGYMRGRVSIEEVYAFGGVARPVVEEIERLRSTLGSESQG